MTGIVALPGPGWTCAQLLDNVPGRTRAAAQPRSSGCDPAWRDAITTASLDPFRGYATALTHSLPGAVRVLDAFHVVRLEQAAVDEVRRRVQQQTLGRRGHADDPLYRARRDLRRGLAHITVQRARLELALVIGDPSGQLTDTWMAAQELQPLYARNHDLADAKRRLWRILWTAAPAPRCPSCAASPAPSTPGVRSCWPTGRRPAGAV